MPLNVTAANPGDDPVLYAGTGIASNKLVVTFENAGDAPLTLTAGPPVPEQQSRRGVSYTTASINFGRLLDPPDLAKGLELAVGSADGSTEWKSVWDGKDQCLAPSKDFQLEPGRSITVAITKWPDFAAATHGQMTVEWTNFGAERSASVFVVMVLRPPGAVPAKLHDDVRLTLEAPKPVTVGDAATTLILRLTNRKPEKLVTAAGKPQFTLLLACAPEPSEQTLTTCSDALDMNVTPSPRDVWKGGGADELSSPPSWTLTPLTPEVIDAKAFVEFELSPLLIPKPAGQGLLYLMYSHVPGYDDGYLPLLIRKYAPPAIGPFTATPQVVDTSKSSVDVKLCWTVTDADTLEIQPGIGVVKDPTGCSTSVDGTTQFVLTATGRGGKTSKSVTVYDFPGFLERHTFTLVTGISVPMEGHPLTVTLTETLTFDRDNTGLYDVDFDVQPAVPLMPSIPTMPITWKLAGNTVTMVAPDPKYTFVAQIVGGTLQWVQPFDLLPTSFGLPDRRGKPFDTAERTVA